MTVDDKDIRLHKYEIYVMMEKGIQRYVSLVTVTEFFVCWKKIVARKPCAKGILRIEREHSISLDRGLRDKLFNVRERERERERESLSEKCIKLGRMRKKIRKSHTGNLL